MDIIAVGAGALPWYDRGSIVIGDFYAALPTPHAETTRVSYIVPSDKAARISSYHFYYKLNNVQSSNGTKTLRYYFKPSGGAEIQIAHAHIFSNNGADLFPPLFFGELWMRAGDELRGSSEVAGTGGTMYLWFGLVGNEYTP